ncbi:MAG TPA: hypothetical protein PLD23_08050 [Armatimonadota bacterium]|nr:hypothetical protein [Armatimonadota bacterium]
MRGVLCLVGATVVAFGGPANATPVVLFDDDAEGEISVVDSAGATKVELTRVGVDGGVAPVRGERMLRLAGTSEAPAGGGGSRAYIRFWTGHVPVTAGMRLSYCVYARPESVAHGFAIDLAAPDFYPNNLRDQPAAVDQNGVRAHPSLGFLADRSIGQWCYREISLEAIAGREITAAYAAWDAGGPESGPFAGYFDQVMLWTAGDTEAQALADRCRAACAPGAMAEEDLSAFGVPVGLGAPAPLAPVSPTLAPPPADAGLVVLGANGYFQFSNGQPFLPWGMFGSEIYTQFGRDGLTGPGPWWSHVPPAGDVGDNSEPVEISEDDWTAYFAECRRRGITALRLFTYGHATPEGEPGYYFPLDAVGKVHPVLWGKLDRFMQAGYEQGILFLFTLIASPDWMPYVSHPRPDSPANQVLHEARRQYAAEELTRLDAARRRFLLAERTVSIGDAFRNDAFFEDADIAACVENYLRDLLRRLAADQRVFGLEIMNETFPTKYAQWARDHVVRLCRELAPGRPVTVSHTLGSGVQSLEAASFVRTAGLDFYNWHSYLRQNAPVTMELASNCLFYNAPVPGFPTEGPAYYGGMDPGQVDERSRRLAIRDYLWLPLVTGCPGSILWAPENSRIAPAEWEELGRFHAVLAEISGGIDFAALRREPPAIELAVDLPPGLRLAYTTRCLRHGTAVGFGVDGSTGAAVRISEPEPLADLTTLPRPVRAVGCDLAPYLAREGYADVIAYLPNRLREARGTAARPVELVLNLPPGRYRARAYAIGEQTRAEGIVDAHCRVAIAESTTDDYVVWLQRLDSL